MLVNQHGTDGSQASLGYEHRSSVSEVQFLLSSFTGMLCALIYKTDKASGQTQPREIKCGYNSY